MRLEGKSTEMNINEVGRYSCELTVVFGVDELPRTGTPNQRTLADVLTAAAHKAIFPNCHQREKSFEPSPTATI